MISRKTGISKKTGSVLRLLLLAAAAPLIAGVPALSPACAAEAQAARFDVTVRGEGPDVILIPGLASSAHVWDVEAAKLKGYRLHIVQVRGFAGTAPGANAEGPIVAPTVEDLAAYIKAKGLNHPAVIGHSLGGLMGLMLADRHPELVGKLMIVDALPFYGMLFGPTATVASVEPQAKAFRDQIAGGTQAGYAAFEPSIMARLIKSKGPEADAAVAAAQASDHVVVARAMYEDFTTDLRPDLASIKTPVVMLYPWDAATGAPQAMFDSLYQGAYAPLPNKRLVRIDGSMHFIMIDQPEAFDREVKAFLAQ
jgi:pimeloyl-ACP methyl ester carboxylesterase